MANLWPALVCSRSILITVLIVLANTVVQAGTLTIVHSFANSPHDGRAPMAGVVIGPGGVLYGTTYYGGAGNCGTVFSLTPPAVPGDAWTRSMYSLPGTEPACIGGSYPVAPPTIARGGAVLYGSTQFGGNCPGGTIFELRPPTASEAWAENVLLNACAGSELVGPNSSPVVGSNGVLYATILGGFESKGRVLSLTPPASPGGSWPATTLHTFTGGSDGLRPNGVALGSNGQLYGTTEAGGTGPCYGDFSGCGTIFSLTPPQIPGGPWVETILHNFTGRIGDGTVPLGGVLVDNSGALFGTASSGSDGSVGNNCSEGCGAVWSMIPPGSSGEGKSRSCINLLVY
jgi:uncharacterized repeat protein (TIGR03803 family)